MPKYKCRYAETCPAATGWCQNAVPNGDCLERVIGLYNTMASSRGVIVVQVNAFVKDKTLNDLHRLLCEQMESGIVTIPRGRKPNTALPLAQ